MDFQHYSLDLCAVCSPDYIIKRKSLTAGLQGPLLKLERPFICCVRSVLSNYPALHPSYSRLYAVVLTEPWVCFQLVPVDPKPSLATASSCPLLGVSGVCLDILDVKGNKLYDGEVKKLEW